MIPNVVRVPLRVLVVLPLLVLACNGSDKGPIQPNSGIALPAVPPVAQVSASVDFEVSADSATAEPVVLETTCDAELKAVAKQVAMAPSLEGPLSNAAWGVRDGNCVKWSYNEDGCVTIYQLCQDDSVYDWTRRSTGTCGLGTAYTDSVQYSGRMVIDGSRGQERVFQKNTATPLISWNWTRTSPGPNTWSYWSGDIGTGNPVLNLSTQVVADTTKMSWEWLTPPVGLGTARIMRQASISLDGQVGWFRFYTWNDSVYALLDSVGWNHGSGIEKKLDYLGHVYQTYNWAD